MLQQKNRILYEVGIGLAIAVLFKTFLFQRRHFFDDEIIYVTLITVILLEGNIKIVHWLNQKISWIHFPIKRMMIQLIANLSFTLLILINAILIINYFKFGVIEVFSPKLKEVFIPKPKVLIQNLQEDLIRIFTIKWKKLEKFIVSKSLCIYIVSITGIFLLMKTT